MILYRSVAVFILCVALLSPSYAQNPGLVLQTGLSAAYCKDTNVTPGGRGHYGWMVGADARLLEGDLYFLVGGQYHFSNLTASKSPDFFKNNDWQLLMLRLGMGFNLLHLSDRSSLRSKLLASFNFPAEAPKNGLGKEGYEQLNDSFLGATTGLGLTLGSFDIDLEYQYGIINAFYKKPDSTFDIFTLSVGFHF
ncbi:MAG: hypothetical protein IPM26_12920 [Saprospiraceae bacterium]|nr:hypothetical protein [Saprospiraceae bacterium]